MAEYIEYHPLKFWLDPASIAEIVAHIQSYLVANPINSTTEIETIIHDYLIAHPELIGGVDSVNGQTGEVVLTADNISAGENVTIKDVLDSLQDQIDDIVASIPSDYQQLINDVSDLKSATGFEVEINASKNSVVNLGGVNGTYATYPKATVKRINNLFYADGEIISNTTRFALTGTETTWVSSTPTHEKVPNWYVDGLTDFVVGHKYRMSIKLMAGTYTQSDPTKNVFFTIRTTDQSLNKSYKDGEEWSCTVVPNMVCFVLQAGTAADCVWALEIVDITAQEQEIRAKAGLFDYSVPPYFDTQLSSAITKINSNINSSKTEGSYGTDIESFVFITDVHWANNKHHSPGLIKRILESCPIRTVICGGDFVENSNTKPNAVAEIKGFTDAITGIPCYDYFAVCGNHDANTIGGNAVADQMTKEEEYNLIYAPFAEKANVHWIWDESQAIYNDAKIKNDYYLDHARTRTRYLCLDWSHPVNGARKAWIESVLAKDDGFRVVIIYHGIYSGSGETLTPEHTTIMNVIAPYKSKIVALFTGHAHQDQVVDYYEDGSVPVIITSCDKFSVDAGAIENTINEQCFDVAVIDYTQNKIELTRVGRGTNRTININVG